MRGWLLLLASLPALLAPSGAACSLAYPGPFVTLEWRDGDTLLTNEAFDVGFFKPSTARYSQLADTYHKAERQAALSPDGRWLVYAYSEGLGADCSSTFEATYALDRSSGAKAKLRGESLNVIGTKSGVVLADHQGTIFDHYAWGKWDAPRALPTPWTDSVRHFGVPGTDLLVSHSLDEDLVYVLDVASRRSLGSVPVRDRVLAPSASPDQRHVMLATGDAYGDARGHDLILLEVAGGDMTAKARWRSSTPLREYSDGGGVTWGSRGVLVTLEGGLRWIERPLEARTLSLIAATGELKEPEWAPDGERAAVGEERSLRLFNLRYRTEERFTLEDDRFVRSSPRLTLTSVPDSSYQSVGVPTVETKASGPETSVGIPGMGAALVLVALLGAIRLRR